LCSLTRRQYKRCHTLREAVGVDTFLPDYMELAATRREDPSQNEHHGNPNLIPQSPCYHIHDILYSRFFILKKANEPFYEQCHITNEKFNVMNVAITTLLEISQLYLLYTYCILLIFRFFILF
jgi:hypothetical protein